jgi:hypothetical protein
MTCTRQRRRHPPEHRVPQATQGSLGWRRTELVEDRLDSRLALSGALTCSYKPRAETTFNTGASSSFPEEDRDLHRLSLPRPATRAI